MNFDFGRDFGARAGQHFSNGEYAAGALNLMAGTGEAMMNTAAIAGAAFLGGAGVNAVMPLIQNHISNIAIFSSGAINGITPGIPMPITNLTLELIGIAGGFVGSVIYDERERLREWYRNE